MAAYSNTGFVLLSSKELEGRMCNLNIEIVTVYRLVCPGLIEDSHSCPRESPISKGKLCPQCLFLTAQWVCAPRRTLSSASEDKSDHSDIFIPGLSPAASCGQPKQHLIPLAGDERSDYSLTASHWQSYAILRTHQDLGIRKYLELSVASYHFCSLHLLSMAPFRTSL